MECLALNSAKDLPEKIQKNAFYFFQVPWWPAHYPSTSFPATHSGTESVCVRALSLIKTDFPIHAQNGYSVSSGSCCLRWQSNSSIFQSYIALVKLILHPGPKPKNKSLVQYLWNVIMYVFYIFNLDLTYSSKQYFVKWKKKNPLKSTP